MADLLKKTTSLETLRVRAKAESGWFFYLNLFIFFLLVASYGGFLLLNRNQKDARDLLLEEIKSKENELRPELFNQIFAMEKQLKNIRTLISSRTFTSNIFGLLEANTLPQVRFTDFNFSADPRKIDLSGEAANYRTLAEQIAIFERHPQVEKVDFGGLSRTSTGLVAFKLAITLNPALLKSKP